MFKFFEKILLNEIKKGNGGAFAKLYDEYNHKIYRFIYFKVNNRETAQDLASQTFIKFLEYVRGGKTIDHTQAFLYKIARNLIIDNFRQSLHTARIDEKFLENIPSEENLDERVSEKIIVEHIEEKLKQLQEPYREILILRFIEDLPHKEIASIVGLKENTVRVMSMRGIEMLKKELHNTNE